MFSIPAVSLAWCGMHVYFSFAPLLHLMWDWWMPFVDAPPMIGVLGSAPWPG